MEKGGIEKEEQKKRNRKREKEKWKRRNGKRETEKEE